AFKGDYNLSSDRSIKFKGTGNLMNVDPLLTVPAMNGGQTETAALMDGSPAIDAGSPYFFSPLDQRGVNRPYGQRSDIGAYEYGLTLRRPTVTVGPVSQTAQVGARITFTVTVRGDPPFQYQWQRNNLTISQATGPSYTVESVSATDDNATYNVTVG